MNEPKFVQEEQKRDHALYFVEDGQDGFSPEHNKWVIEETIRKTEAMRRARMKAYEEAIAERSNAVVSYIHSRAADSNRPVEQYFGKRMMAQLRGEKIAEVLQGQHLIGGKKRKLYVPGN